MGDAVPTAYRCLQVDSHRVGNAQQLMKLPGSHLQPLRDFPPAIIKGQRKVLVLCLEQFDERNFEQLGLRDCKSQSEVDPLVIVLIARHKRA